MINNIETVYREGRLIRGKWSSVDSNGRQLLCLLTALAGDPAKRPESCSSDLCPPWLAYLLPWIDDAPAESDWPAIIERLIPLAPHLALVRPHVEWQVRAACVREAMAHTDDAAVLAVCESAAGLCEKRGRGESVSDDDMSDSSAAAWAAARAADAAAWAASAAASASRIANRILDLIEADLRAQGAIK